MQSAEATMDGWQEIRRDPWGTCDGRRERLRRLQWEEMGKRKGWAKASRQGAWGLQI
jgi:hypothetical protein